jgi:hypothetical protein
MKARARDARAACSARKDAQHACTPFAPPRAAIRAPLRCRLLRAARARTHRQRDAHRHAAARRAARAPRAARARAALLPPGGNSVARERTLTRALLPSLPPLARRRG